MKVIEIMKLGRIFLDLLQKACIKLEDTRHIEMYDEYVRMKQEGCKKSYIIATLVDLYHVSERQIYYIIKKFESDCNFCAD